MINRLLLSTAFLAAFGATSAYAGCTTVARQGNINFLSGASDNTCADNDDLKLFLDGVTNANSAGGSLGGNNNSPADSNITITSNGDGFTASTDGNGFANFKSVSDNVTAYEATPNDGTILPKTDGTLFEGFDGALMRGQLVNNPNGPGNWDGDVTIIVDISTPSGPVKVWHTFSGFKQSKDIGVIGFDEASEPAGYSVTDYFAYAGDVSSTGIPVLTGRGSWDEYKQIEMSVPGAIVPEPSTWAMMLSGFALMGWFGMRARKRLAYY